MNHKKTKKQIFWSAITLLSLGTLIGCEYCAPIMLALLSGSIIYNFTQTIIESLQIQPLR
jgi:threonine/homoserine efflux transporter RhtA